MAKPENTPLHVAERWRARPGRIPALLVGTWLAAASPAVFLVALLSHAMHARITLGHWPVAYLDKPTSLLINAHTYILLVPAFYIAAVALPCWLVVAAFPYVRRSLPHGVLLRQALLVVGVLTLLFLWGRLDPHGYIDWLLD